MRVLEPTGPSYRPLMLTGVFKERTRSRRSLTLSPEDVLATLLRSPRLPSHRFVQHCEIGPFIVSHLCVERALAVELSRDGAVAPSKKHFLESLGYGILTFSHRDVLARPKWVLARVQAALAYR